MRHSEVIRVIAKLRSELACVDRAILSLQRVGHVDGRVMPGPNRQPSGPAKTKRSKAAVKLLAKLIAHQRAAETSGSL